MVKLTLLVQLTLILIIGSWAEAVWGGWMARSSLITLFQGAMATTVKRAKRTWAAVHGPAAACFASLGRLQWTAESALGWTTDRGMSIDLRRDSPAFVKTWLYRLCAGGGGDASSLDTQVLYKVRAVWGRTSSPSPSFVTLVAPLVWGPLSMLGP